MMSNHEELSLRKSGPSGPSGPSSLNMIDDVTLAFMVNTVQYEKYLKKITLTTIQDSIKI